MVDSLGQDVSDTLITKLRFVCNGDSHAAEILASFITYCRGKKPQAVAQSLTELPIESVVTAQLTLETALRIHGWNPAEHLANQFLLGAFCVIYQLQNLAGDPDSEN